MTAADVTSPSASVWDEDEPTAPLLRTLLLGIAATTVATGGVQVLLPDFVLGLLDADRSRSSRQLFTTVGMFMVVVGGGLLETLLAGEPDPTILRWTGVQKVGAAGAVAIGVRRHVFAPRALVVAGFDLASGIMCFAYARRFRRDR